MLGETIFGSNHLKMNPLFCGHWQPVEPNPPLSDARQAAISSPRCLDS
jgi:hypothetical protein